MCVFSRTLHLIYPFQIYEAGGGGGGVGSCGPRSSSTASTTPGGT